MENNKDFENKKRTFPYAQVIFIAFFSILIIYSQTCVKDIESIRKLPEGWINIKPPQQITSLVQMGDDVYSGGTDGVFKIEMSTGKVLEQIGQNQSMSYVRSLFVDENGSLWIGHLNGLTHYDGKSFTTYTTKEGIPSNRVNAIIRDSKGLLWIGTQMGAASFDGKSWRTLTNKDGLMVDSVNAIFEDKNGGFWFGSSVSPYGGVSYLKEGNWQYYSIKEGLPHNNINTFIEDKNGSVWVGTGFLDNGGACKFDYVNNKWVLVKKIRKEEGLAGDKVCSIFEKGDTLWFGSEYDGITYIKKDKMTILNSKDGFVGNEVKTILQDTKGNMWFGSPEGITRVAATAANKF